jgi:hypothetical protein
MKILRYIIPAILSPLLTGCYTQSSLGRSEPAPDSSVVAFHLFDGREINSPAGEHRRVEEGYQVSGDIVANETAIDVFEGVITDDEISSIAIVEYSVTGTVALVIGVVIAGVLMLTGWGSSGL